ncbi:hypothetical protein A6V36_28280 [Paraburkholderia ginsengiterrae]|uniref:Uncharacterized protein n=1 Tax=Paraburkholderia ginsengiterrae TaxID=1462993 RepID=A0A1A9N6D1_9BURK|nr:hypothetical protein A6V36_28280 [Paraburkholderia ginsengiterrae]OAJ60179.1 hypothetical protein A6V37_25885 [Paraburkholderia ginsengiterrae]
MAALAVAIGCLRASSHDNASLVEQLRTVAREAASNLQFELGQLRGLCDVSISDLKLRQPLQAIDLCAVGPSIFTRH